MGWVSLSLNASYRLVGTEDRTALISLGIPKLVRFHKKSTANGPGGIVIPISTAASAPRRTRGWRARCGLRSVRRWRLLAHGNAEFPENRENNREFCQF